MGGKPKSKKSSKEASKKSSKKSSKKNSKEKDNKSKTSKKKSPNSKNDSLIIKDEDINDKKPQLEPILNPNINPNPLPGIDNNIIPNKFYPNPLDNNQINPYIQIQNGGAPPDQRQNFQPPIFSNEQKCEGCFTADAVCFCKECGKAYCPTCDSQIHLVPIFKNHERVPITEMKHLKHLCVHHNLPLKLFCDSCNEPACDECKISGPHDNKLHNVKNIIEAYNEKYRILMNITENKIINEINYLIGNQNLIENKIKELENKSNIIEKEINEAYYQNIEKLKSEKGKRIAILNYESAKYQKEMINIQEIVKFNEEFSKNNKNYFNAKNEEEKQIEYLLKYKSILENIESIISKPLPDVNIEQGLDEMPLNELTQMLKMENYNKIKNLLKVKNDIIWNLILMRKKIPDKIIKQTKENFNKNNLNNNYNNDIYDINKNKEEYNDMEVYDFLNDMKIFIKRSNFNLFQLLSEKSDSENKENIKKDNLLMCLQKLNLDINDEKLTKVLNKYELFNDSDAVNINQFLKLVIGNY